MKIIGLVLLLVPNLVFGQICPQAKPMQKRFDEQKKWQSHQLNLENGFGQVEGYVDEHNNFFMDSLTRKAKVRTKLSVDPANEDYKEFFKFCADYRGKAKFLESFRRAKAGNKYSLKVKYLPSFSQFTNNPLKGIEIEEIAVGVKYSPFSLLSRQVDSVRSKKELLKLLQQRIEVNPSVGSVELDLTNMDDLACDIVHGKAKINVLKRMYSDGLFVVKDEKISSKDANKIYSTWKDTLGHESNREKNIFKAGLSVGVLQYENHLEVSDMGVVVRFLNLLIDPLTGQFNYAGSNQLKCMVDSLHDYRTESTDHVLNIEFRVNKLGSLASEDKQ